MDRFTEWRSTPKGAHCPIPSSTETPMSPKISAAKSALSPCKTGHLYLALTLLDAIR
jgi:hypothetical protein